MDSKVLLGFLGSAIMTRGTEMTRLHSTMYSGVQGVIATARYMK